MRMKPPTVTVHEARARPRGGRPSISTSGSPPGQVHVTLDADDYDRAHQLASRERVTMPELLRRALRQFVERGGR